MTHRGMNDVIAMLAEAQQWHLATQQRMKSTINA
jgi:hypothetical protein